MFLTAVHEIHIGVDPKIVPPGDMFEIDDAEGAKMVSIGAAREPSAEERVIFGLDKPTKVVATSEPTKRGRKPKAAEPELPLSDDV